VRILRNKVIKEPAIRCPSTRESLAAAISDRAR
jgi:hypothetical protein